MSSKPPASLATALRNTFQLYQYILNSPDVMDSPQPTGEVSKVLRKFFGGRNVKSMQEFLQAVEAHQNSDVELSLFSRFLHDVYDTDDLSFFLHGWSKVMALVFADPNCSRRGPEHNFLKWAKLGAETCAKLSREIFDQDQWLGEPFWAQGRSEAPVAAFDFLASALSEYREIMSKPRDGLAALRVQSSSNSAKSPKTASKQLGTPKQLGRSVRGGSGPRKSQDELWGLSQSGPAGQGGSDSAAASSSGTWASAKRVDALAREVQELRQQLDLQSEQGMMSESQIWDCLAKIEGSDGGGAGVEEKKVLQILESQDQRLEDFEQLILDQQGMLLGESSMSSSDPQIVALVERQMKLAEERLGRRLEARIDQLIAATAIAPAAPATPAVDEETSERIFTLESRLEQTWQAVEKLKCENTREPEEALKMVIEHEERLSRIQRDVACLGSRSRGGAGGGANSGGGGSNDMARVEARMRTEMNKKAKNNDEKIDGALRRVAHLSQRIDSELPGIESACSEFQELAALLSHKVEASCEDIQALDDSLSCVKESVSGIVDTKDAVERRAGAVQEEIQQLEARLSVLADQYSGTTEMYSAHMDQNTLIMNELVEKVDSSSMSCGEIEAMRAQIQDLKFQFDEMAHLTRQGTNAVHVLDEKLQQSLGESAIKVDELESRVLGNTSLAMMETPIQVKIDGLECKIDEMSSSNVSYQEATSQLMATVADLEEMQQTMHAEIKAGSLGNELVLANTNNQMVPATELTATQSRLSTIEKSQRQLGQSCRTMKETLNRSCRDMLALSVNQLKEEVAAEEKKVKSQVNSKIKANAQQTDRRFGEFEEKLLSRVAEIISSLQASKAEAEIVTKLEGRMQTLETWGTPSDKRLKGMQEKLEELETSLSARPAAPPSLPPPLPQTMQTAGPCAGCASNTYAMDKLSMTVKTKLDACEAKGRKHDDRMQAMLLKLDKRCSETEEAIEILMIPKSHDFASPKRSTIRSPKSMLSPEIA